jgi:hypothetical protein
MYADVEYYSDTYGGDAIPENELDKQLNKAGRQIDTLTFCRIRGRGFDNLTPFQREQVKHVNCLLADFLYENRDELETMLASYSINGVSMKFGEGANITKVQGVVLRTDIYTELVKTGLCDRRA